MENLELESPAVHGGGPAAAPQLLLRRLERDLHPGDCRRDANRDELELRFRIAVAVAALVLGLERLAKLLRAGRSVARNRQLKSLTAITKLIAGE